MKKTTKKTQEQPQEEVTKPAAPVMLKVEITAPRAKVGSCICAKGAVISITKEQADALVGAELAKIIGI